MALRIAWRLGSLPGGSDLSVVLPQQSLVGAHANPCSDVVALGLTHQWMQQ